MSNIYYKIWATDDLGLFIDLKGTLSKKDAEVLRTWKDNAEQLFLYLYEKCVKGKVDDGDYKSMSEFITKDLFHKCEIITYIDPESEYGSEGQYQLYFNKASSDEIPGQIIEIVFSADDCDAFPRWIHNNYHQLSKADREAKEREQAMWDDMWDD